MYNTVRTIIREEHPLYEYCLKTLEASKSLYNASMFRIRNRFTGYSKASLTENEMEVAEEIRLLEQSHKITGNVKAVISYFQLEKLMRVTNNPDFFNTNLSRQTAQHVVQEAVGDFSDWLSSVREYKKNPSKFFGRPQMPHYKKAPLRTTSFTNQDCTLKEGGYIKFPLTRTLLKIGGIPADARLKMVEIKPYYDAFVILCTFETKEIEKPDDCSFMAGIDLGVDNIAAITTNEEVPFCSRAVL